MEKLYLKILQIKLALYCFYDYMRVAFISGKQAFKCVSSEKLGSFQEGLMCRIEYPQEPFNRMDKYETKLAQSYKKFLHNQHISCV